MTSFSDIQTYLEQGPRDDQQDVLLARPDLLVVVDGMGGHPRGREAADLVCALLAADPTPEGLIQADRAVATQLPKSGAAVAFVAPWGPDLIVGWMGDVRVLHIPQNQPPTWITIDHTVAGGLYATGVIGEADYVRHRGGPTGGLQSFAGSAHFGLSKVGVREVPFIASGDRILVMSDGLYATRTAADLATRITNGGLAALVPTPPYDNMSGILATIKID